MSMLTAQADELRDRAHDLTMLSKSLEAPYVVPETKKTMMLAMQTAANRMREAADTILDMRERLQDVQTAKERAYNAGFDNGMKATLQQLSGLIAQGAYVDEIKEWAYRQWEEEVV